MMKDTQIILKIQKDQKNVQSKMFQRVFRVFKLIRRQLIKESSSNVEDSHFNGHMKAFLKENFRRCFANEDNQIEASQISHLIQLCGGADLTEHQVFIALKRANHQGNFLSYKSFLLSLE